MTLESRNSLTAAPAGGACRPHLPRSSGPSHLPRTPRARVVSLPRPGAEKPERASTPASRRARAKQLRPLYRQASPSSQAYTTGGCSAKPAGPATSGLIKHVHLISSFRQAHSGKACKVRSLQRPPFGGWHLFPYDAGMSGTPAISNPAAADLARLQHELLRARIDRARRLTEDQRLAEAFDLTNGTLRRMHDGAMAKVASGDPLLGWEEVRRGLFRLRRAQSLVPPATSQSVSR